MGVSARSDRRSPMPMARMAPAASLLVVAGVVAAACGSGPGPSSEGSGARTGPPVTLTLYNAQHEQTTDALIAAFTEATGIKVRVDNDNEDDLTARIELEGSRSPADLVLYGELQLAPAARRPRAVDQGRRRHPRPSSRGRQRHQRRLGRGVGADQRPGLQPGQGQRVAAAHLGARAGRSQVEGQDRDRSRRRPTSGPS